MKRVFITGGTGFVGSNFLLKSIGSRVERATVLARSSGSRSAESRVRDALLQANAGYAIPVDVDRVMSAIDVVEGDITTLGLGISSKDIQPLLGRFNEVWHFAATLNYEKFNSDGISATNVEGTENVLAFAKAIDADTFNYISTAYVCGRLSGQIAEEILAERPAFNNLYEQSKFDAELLVASAAEKLGVATRIIRPSIVIGNSETYRRGNTAAGLYGFIKQMFSLKRALERSPSTVRIFGDLEATANFVPVNWVISDLMWIIDEPTTGLDIFHVTSDGGPNNLKLIDILKDEIDAKNILAARSGSAVDLSPVERLIEARTAYYASYAASQKSFVSRRKNQRKLTAEDMRQFVRDYITELTQGQSTSLFRHQQMQSNGHLLNVYDMGLPGRDVALICNAAGMPIELIEPLARTLSERFHVISWESRLYPSIDPDWKDWRSIAVREHVDDGIAVVEAFGAKAAHVLGWCNGVRIALGISVSRKITVNKLVLMSGSFGLPAMKETQFEQTMRAVMPSIAGNPPLAEKLLQSFFGSVRQDGDVMAIGGSASDTLLHTTDPDLVHLIGKPFSTADSIGRYSRLITGFAREVGVEPAMLCDIPTLVIVGSADISVEPSASHTYAAGIRDGTLIEIEGADHFAPANNREYQREVSRWLG